MASGSKIWLALAAASMVATAAGTAQAAASYGNIADPPGVYFGSGNVNGNWTIDTSNGVEVALRAKDRGTGATLDGSSGIYRAPTGLCNPLCTGGPKAAWNYEFSVNTHVLGTSDLTVYTVQISIDTNPTAGVSFTTLDVYTNWTDNEFFGPGTTQRDGPGVLPGEFGVQQSSNPLFADSGFGFLPGPGLYDILLVVLDENEIGVASTHIQVAVPEPATALLLGIGLAGIGFATRRRKAA